MLRAETQQIIRLGIIGTGRIANRFVSESECVSGIDIKSCFNPDIDQAKCFFLEHNLPSYATSLEQMLEGVDAVYIASPHITHYGYAKQCLEGGKHVLCEIPMVLSYNEADELYKLAEEKGLVLLEASKTAFCPAWGHLLSLVKSGVIGDIVDVKASLSKLMPKTEIREFDPSQYGGSITELSPLCLMAIIKLLGKDYVDLSFYSKMNNGVDIFTKGNIIYSDATASITLGLGVKTEGNLVVSGTKGYVLVPSPWWLTNYFEVRYEDQNLNKKYFYTLQGTGLRYEIQEFASMIFANRKSSFRLKRSESKVIAEIIETYQKGDKTIILK